MARTTDSYTHGYPQLIHAKMKMGKTVRTRYQENNWKKMLADGKIRIISISSRTDKIGPGVISHDSDFSAMIYICSGIMSNNPYTRIMATYGLATPFSISFFLFVVVRNFRLLSDILCIFN